jgi:hypothetical protein
MSELMLLIGSGTSFGLLGLGLILLTTRVEVGRQPAQPIPLKARSKRSF